METDLPEPLLGFGLKVPSLPKRNGNRVMWPCFVGGSWVPSLPKRNGNISCKYCTRLLCRVFPAYLRGMETVKSPVNLMPKGHVPSLPKRNGNAFLVEFGRTSNLVPSLPKRNGNMST